MQEKTAEIELLMNGPGLRRSELTTFIADSQKAASLVMRGLTSAADLVNSFKQVAVDRTTEQRRFFNLQQVCHEIIATMMNRIRAANHSIELEVPDTVGMRGTGSWSCIRIQPASRPRSGSSSTSGRSDASSPRFRATSALRWSHRWPARPGRSARGSRAASIRRARRSAIATASASGSSIVSSRSASPCGSA